MPRTSAGWSLAFKLVLETLFGAFLFVVIAVVAAALNVLVDFLALKKVDRFLIWGLVGAEYLLFICDLILFARFLWAQLIKIWNALS